MVVECKKREITNTVKMEGYKNRTIVTNDENRLMTCDRYHWSVKVLWDAGSASVI
ncbi:hypothetical protein BS78_02G228700 [Paspalum vaginatum]|nr:hypothetical protein BS78_02G228700 [Paspalum vaginatum]